jgi:hypothetical protein
MLAGQLDLVQGSVELCRARRDLAAEDRDSEVLSPFIAFDSTLDDFPLGEVRTRWDPIVLAQKDRELAALVESAGPRLLEACRSLLAAWSP